MMDKLDGKIVLITGGSEGIGFATAKQFLIEGTADVFITGRRQDVLDEAVKLLDHENVTAIQNDISNMTDLDRLYSVIQKEKGHLDILFVNAGFLESSRLEHVTEEHYDKLFKVDVKGTLSSVQKALPVLGDGASIVLNGSIGSVQGFVVNHVYCASKAVLRSFTRCWAVDLKERTIRVNILVIGPTDTPALRKAGNTEEERKQFRTALTAGTVINRIGTADELAKAVVFLASEDSSYITGIELFVDGGYAQI